MINGPISSKWHLGIKPSLYAWHLGFGNRETWGWIITDDINNKNNNGLSPSYEHIFCGCDVQCEMMDQDNVAFYCYDGGGR